MRVGSKAQVMHGTALETAGGLRVKDIRTIVKDGARHFVSRKKNVLGTRNPWIKACKKAREALKIEGFVKKGVYRWILLS